MICGLSTALGIEDGLVQGNAISLNVHDHGLHFTHITVAMIELVRVHGVPLSSFWSNRRFSSLNLNTTGRHIPEELQGRVNSLFRLIGYSGKLVGYALTGLLLQRLGTLTTILLFFARLLLLALLTTLRRQSLETSP
jgi:hypothetical protein